MVGEGAAGLDCAEQASMKMKENKYMNKYARTCTTAFDCKILTVPAVL